MDIDNLLNKYFEGETSAEEERLIRKFFAGNVPERLIGYKPLFAYFDREIRKVQKPDRKTLIRRRIVWFSGIAASLLLIAGLWSTYNRLGINDPCLCSANYVIINGQCYTDLEKAQAMALEALHEVAAPAADLFPDDDFFNN